MSLEEEAADDEGEETPVKKGRQSDGLVCSRGQFREKQKVDSKRILN
jgi:hypothetical protein